ncbi:hypothetical protein BC828DRAFT_383328 [Blastocladiella britannica]|nr:hypothetical protein BC828DRAFT_383328 [Blastocladiella britannica]
MKTMLAWTGTGAAARTLRWRSAATIMTAAPMRYHNSPPPPPPLRPHLDALNALLGPPPPPNLQPAATNEQPATLHARLLHHCHTHRPRAALEDYRRLVESNASVPASTTLTLVDALLRRKPAATDTRAASLLLATLSGSDAPNQYMRLVDRACQSNQLDVADSALAHLTTLSTEEAPTPRLMNAYASVLTALRRAGRYDDVVGRAGPYAAALGVPQWTFLPVAMTAIGRQALARRAKGDPADPDGEKGLERARAMYAEYLAASSNDGDPPRRVASTAAAMASMELAAGNVGRARAIIDALPDDGDHGTTAEVCGVRVRLALADGDLPLALAHLDTEMQLARRRPTFSLSTDLVVRSLMTRGDTARVAAVLDAYGRACMRLSGTARVQYQPYAAAMRSHAARAVAGAVSRSDAEVAIERLWATIPGAPALHDYAVGMVVRAYVNMGSRNKIAPFVDRCLQDGYRPGPDGWTHERAVSASLLSAVVDTP